MTAERQEDEHVQEDEEEEESDGEGGVQAGELKDARDPDPQEERGGREDGQSSQKLGAEGSPGSSGVPLRPIGWEHGRSEK